MVKIGQTYNGLCFNPRVVSDGSAAANPLISFNSELRYLLCELMASASSSVVSTSSQLPTSSTSPPPPLTLWDVFISFRGIDTRYTFTDHLYKALQRTGIRTFMDDPELRSRDVISDGLIQAIQNSKVYVVVLSKNYASSTWCLDELVEILNCHRTMQKLVIPVYHNIDSSVVRHQTMSFKSAFKKHESRPKLGFFRRVSEKDTFHTAAKLEQIEKWRHTLSEVAGFSGQTITAQRNEADIVDEIVEKIFIEINPITLHVAKYPVGLDSHVENITALMSSHPGVTKIGIYGMGGVGKTTLAKAVYNQNYRRFQGSCFLENVRESSVTTRGLVCLQQQLIDNVLKCKNINIDNVNHGIELIKARISSIEVLIVFDDLDDPRSMEFLEGKFALGSIILITTRNEDLLDLINVEAKYKVNELGDAESRQLFAQHAFGDNIISYTSTKSFEEILEHAGGLPLALEVFGSNLLNQSEESWTHFSDELKQVSLDVVERKLMISFDALKSVDPMLQDIFLDIACFFMGWNVEEVVRIMETCYTFLSHNIDILKKRSLLTINNRDELGMHDLLRNMGRKIVRNSSPNEPGKHSRLWVSTDICHVLKKHLGTEAIKGIISSNFNHQDALEGVSFNTEAFKRMSKLRFLKLNKVKLFGSFEQKFGNLRWLCWDGCPLKYLPLEFYPQKLVILELPHSKIGTMGKLNKVFEKLKTLNMKHSLDLTTTPNFSQFPHLEALNFEHCESLEEVHMSIGSLERLVILNLHGCVNLRSLPGSICNLRALKSLNIGGCISLKELPIELGNLESLRELNAEHLTVVKLPDSIGRLSKLVELGLNHNKNLKTLPDSICNLRSLNSLHIAGCSGLEELPKELGKIESLTKLNAWGLTVSKLPDSINCLSKLVELNLNDNKYLEIPPSSLSASGSAPTNRDVLSLREKARVNDLIDGNKKASEGGSAARKFTYSEVPRNSEMTSNKQVKFSDTISSIEMDDPDMEGQQIGRDPSANWSSRNSPYTADDHITSYSPYLPPVLEEPSSSFSKDDDPLPAVEGLQISGEPYPGRELQASAYSINGTTSCNFEWVRHLEDGSVNYIDGAKQPNYLVSADDVDNYLAIEVQPMDDRKRKGELVKVFANENRKIACDPEMHNIIRRNLEAGQASYRISQSVGYLDMWEPAILVVKKEGFNIKGTGSSTSLVTEKFSSATSVIVPCGHPTEFSIISGGVEHLLQAENSPDDIGGARDTIVLTLRLFILREATLDMAGSSSLNSAAEMELQQHHSININASPHPPHPVSPPVAPQNQRPGPTLPSAVYLSEEQRENYLDICLPLYEAALKGDWQAAQKIIGKYPQVINVSITKNYETALHIASSTKHTHFVEELVKFMEPEDLKLQNKNWNTALCIAAAAGTVKIAVIMVKKVPKLLQKRGNNNMSPLLMAALFGHKDMVSYLYSETNDMRDDYWTDTDRIMLLHACVSANLYDVALKILHNHKKELALATDKNALHVLARNPSVFDGTRQPIFWRLLNKILPGPRIGPGEKKCQALEIVQIIWREVVKLKDDDIWNIIRGPPEMVKVRESNHPVAKYVDRFAGYQSRLLFVAAALGNTKFLIELLRLCPELIWKIDDNDRTIFHVAVLHRQESVYNLLYEIGSIKDLVTSFKDTNDNNILHLAAKKPEQSRLHIVSGVALQMQREILWFKEVETMVHPSLREKKNKQRQTPQDLFTEEHADLMEKGERWMKETAAQCIVVAALIATIMFAATFTLPGGNNQESSHPIFKHESAFIVFVITDAVSLFSSSASILMFLAILTARYAERDFLVSLPIKLMIGLLALFISITTMMIAFSARFFLVYTKGMKWVPYLITGLAGVPVLSFARLQYRLFFDVVRTTLSSRFLFKPKKHILY